MDIRNTQSSKEDAVARDTGSMQGKAGCCRATLLLWLYPSVLYLPGGESSAPKAPDIAEPPLCKPGHYCPEGGSGPVPCPRGTFGAGLTSTSVERCTSCPPHHFGPRPGLAACLPCGPRAQQPLPGQDRCVCPGEGQGFQVSDGQCPCVLGYRATGEEGVCMRRVYEICRDGQARTQYGTCLQPEQWSQHCSVQVCSSPEDYAGYDGALGLCLCRGPAADTECAGWCRSRAAQPLLLVCDRQLKLIHSGSQISVSGSPLGMTLSHWDSQGTLQCGGHLNFSRSVYVVQTDEHGFFGMLSLVSADVQRLLLENSQVTYSPKRLSDTHGSLSHPGDEVTEEDESHWSRRGGSKNRNSTLAGILNPTTCLQYGDILLFTVSREHYPQYDIENLYNTNAGYDWGSFRHLAEEMAQARKPPVQFPVIFTEPGVYTLRLSSNHYKHMYVKVMPPGGQCYEVGPFFPTGPHHLTRLGIAKRRHLLLQPDWLVIGGLLVGSVGILSMCITFLILFREYGWPEKVPVRVRYRTLQLRYSLEDYSSKGSQVMAVKKHHRSLQAGGTEGLTQPVITPDEFWDYEQQVDLEAFSTNTFYDILLKHSVSVTTRLSQLRGEVKELYQRVLGKVGALHFGQRAVGGGEKEGYEDLRREVEKELARRRALAAQLGQLLDSQLQMLRAELRSQKEVHRDFGARLREALRLLDHISGGPVSSHGQLWDKHHQHVLQRVSVLAEQMMDLASRDCQRQGAWAVLGEGTGARMLCPKRGVAMSRTEILAPDGTVRVCGAVHVDSCTGLILPNPGTHMRLASGHSMPVPPDFFLHPETGRLLPVAGNVGYDPASSTLVVTVDSSRGAAGKWDSPLLPFVPYPSSHHADPPVTSRLRGLRQGQRMVLGGAHPVQIGSPFLDPHTGNLVLTTGVCLDHSTGKVVPVGGLLLAESFLEPLSGRLVHVGGASPRGGKLVPHAGGFQALLDAQTLGARVRTARLLRGSEDDAAVEPGGVRASATEVEQAWRSGQHCLLQLIGRLETLLEWVWGIAEDGGTQGLIQFPGSELTLPALLGLEYPDPGGSGLKVPVLGAELDLATGRSIPLAGTMEDAEGRGLVPIRIGARTVDPVTGTVETVVGARLDVLRQTVVPVTVSYSLTGRENFDKAQVDALQKEWCVRSAYWTQQRQKEEDLLTEVDRSVQRCFYAAVQSGAALDEWAEKERQLRGRVAELHEEAQAEAQRRAAQRAGLTSLLPPHVLLLLTRDDDLEWEQHCWWWEELGAGLDRVGAGVERLQQEWDRRTARRKEGLTVQHCAVREAACAGTAARFRELWDELNSRQAELEAALTAQLCLREHCQLRADTAQAVLLGSFWYKDFGLPELRGCRNPDKAMRVTQHRVLSVLKRLIQLLEENKQRDISLSTHCWPSSGASAKQTFGLEADSQAWTTSVPAVKGTSAQSEEDPGGGVQSQDPGGSTGPSAPQASPPHTQRTTAPSRVHPKDTQLQELSQYISVPILTEEEWDGLLELSPLFQVLRQVELQLRGRAKEAGLLKVGAHGRGRPFLDLLDAQLECEGELIPLDLRTLSPREVMVYQHGLFLLQAVHAHSQTPNVTLQVATSLPTNNYHHNAFRNSFFYQEAEHTLFVRRQRLQSVGGFSLLLLHCVSHIASGDMSPDTSPAFQRTFHMVLEVCLSELFLTRLGVPPPVREKSPEDTVGGGVFDDLHSQPALDQLMKRMQTPACMHLSEDLLQEHLKKWREVSVLQRIESLVQQQSLQDMRGGHSPAPPQRTVSAPIWPTLELRSSTVNLSM
ncbi:hypothetical protein SKAU_G00082850 [Synaphobranchus kaupii]|uniref:Uncharacterized protein n=1 Tax=Synaphobranchus kaupii TaxID=118154 RepID=A0A9Q1FVG4_SYNKA|nr:hypothetical protein SKAU_G00082850 [Synaphobranchus kaupii]